MKTTPVTSNNPMDRLSCPLVLLVIPLVLACFALLPQARATCQEGCLTNVNTVLGEDALINNNGSENTAVGFNALFSNTGGFANTAEGSRALFSNTTGSLNTAIGDEALLSNTTGISNTAIGGAALGSNITGFSNTAIGNVALLKNTTGNNNTGNGLAALNYNTTGSFNTANGVGALLFNTIGNGNTANGANALLNSTTGNNNTASGDSALLNNTTGNNNIALGASAGTNLTTGSNNIYIGSGGASTESRTIRIGTQHGRTFVAGISGVTVAGGVGVIVDTNGQLDTVVSSERFKDAIKPMDKASEAILALKPVTFRYKHEIDPKGIPQFGLVAEDVEKINPDLVARDDEGKPYTVRYEAVNAMLLNEFLKEHRKVEQLTKDFESKLADQQKQIEALTTGLQKMSAQVELSKPVPQTVLNNQ
jgi:Chaperone of endosialidase